MGNQCCGTNTVHPLAIPATNAVGTSVPSILHHNVDVEAAVPQTSNFEQQLDDESLSKSQRPEYLNFQQQWNNGSSETHLQSPKYSNVGQQCYPGKSRPSSTISRQVTGSSLATTRQNAHYEQRHGQAVNDGYPPNDIEMVLRISKELERKLERDYSASGGGLGEYATQLQ